MILLGPEVEGKPQVAETLTASAMWFGEPPPTVTWAWLQCDPRGAPCSPIDGATADSHVVTAGERGSVLRVRLTVTNADGAAEEHSDATAVVTAAPGTEPGSEPTPVPVAASPEPDAVEPPLRPVAPRRRRAPLLRPFPVVRIHGFLSAAGARVTLLTVRAPRGARIGVRCTGPSCPARSLARTAALVRLRVFERTLRAGTRLVIAVTKAGYIGKHTTIVIRRGAPPRRADRCLYPSGRRPVRCPDH